MNDDTLSGEKLRAMTDEMHRLGTDCDGYDHFVFAARNVVWAESPDGELGGIQQVDSVGAYVDRVRDVVGWDDLNYSDNSLGDELAEIVEETTRQMEAT